MYVTHNMRLHYNRYTNFIISFGGFFFVCSLEIKCLFVNFACFSIYFPLLSINLHLMSTRDAYSLVLSYDEFIYWLSFFLSFSFWHLYAFVISYSDCDFRHKYLLIAHLKLFREMVYQCMPHVWSTVCTCTT